MSNRCAIRIPTIRPAARGACSSTKNYNGANHAAYGYLYDILGNELRETRNIATDPNCTGGGRDTSYFAGDNTPSRVLDSCNKPHRYWSDYAGNRLVQLDTSASGTYLGPQNILTYTARSGSGGFASTGSRDAYPSPEAYHWKNGEPSIVVLRPERNPLRAAWFFPNDRW